MAMSKYPSRDHRVGSARKGVPRRGVPIADPNITGAGPPAKSNVDAVIAAAVAAAPRLTAAQVDEVGALLRQATVIEAEQPTVADGPLRQLGRQAAEPRRASRTPNRDQPCE